MMRAALARRWLQVMALLHILTGLLLPILSGTFLFDVYHAGLLAAFQTEQDAARQTGVFMLGILGPAIASWGLLFLFMVEYAYNQRSMRAWRYMVTAVAAWSLYDMLYSAYYGVMLNVLIDLVVMSLMLIPLLASRHCFNRSPGQDGP